MKKQKYILSALAALSVLTAATSVTAFAGEETPAPENNSLEIITEVAEIPAIAVDSDAEEITKLDAEIIANAEIEETAESEEETVADAETEETTESEEETHKQYGFRKWDCEDWCNFASWLGSAGWRCGRDQMPDVAEENEEAAAEEETEAGSETTYIDDWYDNYFDWNQFSENDEGNEENVEATDEQLAEDDADKDFGYWKWDCWYVQDENADKTDYEYKDWYDFDWSECEMFTEENEQPSELTEEDTEEQEAEKEFAAPKYEYKNWWDFWNENEESASDEDEQPSELTEEDTETKTEEQEAEEAEKEFAAPKYEYKNWWDFWNENEESASDEDEQPSELTEEDTETKTEEQEAEEAEKEFAAPEYEYKNWWGFWNENEESVSDEDEQPSELTEEDTEVETEDEQDTEEETDFVDWMFDEYFNINRFKKNSTELKNKDTSEEYSNKFKKSTSSYFDWNTRSWCHQKTETLTEGTSEETAELAEEAEKAVYVLNVQ